MGKKRSIILATIFFIVIGAFFSFTKPVKASMGIQIIPSLVDDLVEPGETIKRVIKVTNLSTDPATMEAILLDFKPAGEEGKVQLIESNSEEGAYMSSWIDIAEEPIEFAPGEEKSIPYTVTVPENASPGGHYGAISFGTKASKARPGDAEKGAAISVSQQAVSLLFMQVAGDLVEKALVKEFSTSKGLYNTPFEVDFLTRVENLGNNHVSPNGMIEITNMFGKDVASIKVNDKNSNVIPSSVRLFTNKWKGDMGFGKYEATLSLSYGTLVSRGGQGMKTLSVKRYFWIFPIKLMLIAGGILAALILVLVLFLKGYKKKAVARAMKQMGVREKYSLKKRKTSVNGYFSNFLAILIIVAVVLVIVYFLFI